jgi:hypothetical protein
MRRAAVLLLTGVLAGCGGSSDEAAPPTTAKTTTEPASDAERPPRSYEELMSRLPPFDVPASPEVEAYREAAIGGFFNRCISPTSGADEAKFTRANRALLDRVPLFPRAKLADEYSRAHHDGNGCPEGLGPPTSWSTSRMCRIPEPARGDAVVRYYERRLAGWERSFGGPPGCEQGFRRGDAFAFVRACGGPLELEATAMPDWEQPPLLKLPPRPYGAQYPLVTDARTTSEPESSEIEHSETCERMSTHDVPSVIIPPTPGIRAEFKNELPTVGGGGSIDQHVLVESWFDKFFGDCPPTQLQLTIPNPKPGEPPFGIHADVRARSGIEEIPIIDSFSAAHVLWATAESVDGHRGRTVAVLIRR